MLVFRKILGAMEYEFTIIRRQDLVIQFLASLLHRKFFRQIKEI